MFKSKKEKNANLSKYDKLLRKKSFFKIKMSSL